MVGLSIARRFTMLGVGNKPVVFIPKELYFPVFNLKLYKKNRRGRFTPDAKNMESAL